MKQPSKPSLKGFVPSTQEKERGHEALAIDEKGFDPKAFKLLIKAGYDPKENLNLWKLPPKATGKKLHGLNATQIMLKEKRHAIQDSRTWPHRKELHEIANRQSVFDRVLKAKAQIVIFTQVQFDDEDDKESVASSNCISNSVEENIAQTYHITLIEDGEVEEEDAEDAPAELEEDVFAWSYKEMLGLDPKVAVHHLSVKKGARPAKQGHEALSFMDGSSGYNQIRMALTDKELTAFRTPKGIYCYKVLPFGLKNAGATYQRTIQKIFNDMLHKNVECYVDDLVVKLKKRENHFHDFRIGLQYDFLADHPMLAEWDLSDDLPDENVLVIEVTSPWKMYFDGASHKEGAGAGAVFVTSEGEVLPYSFTLTQNCSNNVAEYQALSWD
ncbi:Retrovirus-related Pol polyprotein from transposon.6 [Sesamum angolense]|uniref:Retrovirus-related Pol polyprotein from transposon.6 n=1 Tax=Sesamum angolense TaxID=2727404 RepID=A0AAE1X6K6_9LAMI|nr:Retrovirus-related Pol polyprotein from transposon.6 [Sesamum angolense]